MVAIKEGSKCIVNAGRRKGEEATIVKIVDKNFVMVNIGKKERKSSISHLTPKS